MKVPLEWLKEFVPVRLKPEALAERLTMAGVEVVGVETVQGETVLDLEITPNRADCLSIIGVAREIAAITRQPLKLTAQGSGLRAPGKGRLPTAQSPQPRATPLRIVIEDRKGCQRYIGRLLEGIRVGSSPPWMQRRLVACGARPINNVVDVTNYVLLESGQPLHAFDYARLAQGVIRVRRARAGESLTTLDGVARRLLADTLVIADAKQPVAVAGVMGGVGSEVTDRTQTVLLESALFDPVAVRRTARSLGLSTESSYRFERGVDPDGVERASARAAQLMAELTVGAVTTVKDVGHKASARTTIVLDTSPLNRQLGTSLLSADVRTTLARLGCRVAASGEQGSLRVSVPSFRRDLTQPVDLYEEVARLMGYDQIRTRRPVAPLARPQAAADYQRREGLRSLCAALGLTEVVTWSLVSERDLAQSRSVLQEAVRVANPLSQDHAYLRPSLVIGLIHVVRHNLAQGASGVRVFELGAVVRRDGAARSSQQLGIALSGEWVQDWWAREPGDFFRLKGLLETLSRRVCGLAPAASPADVPWAETRQGAAITLDDRRLGVVGLVSRAIREAMDIKQEVWVAELSVEALLQAARPAPTAQPLNAFPPVKRDLSIVVRDGVPYADVERTIREVGGTLADRAELIDHYIGQPVPPGHHSLTFSIEYQDPTRTLTAEEVDALHRRITEALAHRVGAALR